MSLGMKRGNVSEKVTEQRVESRRGKRGERELGNRLQVRDIPRVSSEGQLRELKTTATRSLNSSPNRKRERTPRVKTAQEENREFVAKSSVVTPDKISSKNRFQGDKRQKCLSGYSTTVTPSIFHSSRTESKRTKASLPQLTLGVKSVSNETYSRVSPTRQSVQTGSSNELSRKDVTLGLSPKQAAPKVILSPSSGQPYRHQRVRVTGSGKSRPTITGGYNMHRAEGMDDLSTIKQLSVANSYMNLLEAFQQELDGLESTSGRHFQGRNMVIEQMV